MDIKLDKATNYGVWFILYMVKSLSRNNNPTWPNLPLYLLMEDSVVGASVF